MIDKHHLEPWQVWNTDESHLLADSRHLPKVATFLLKKTVITDVRNCNEHVTMANMCPCHPPDTG